MSFEAIASVRRPGSSGSFEPKWMTVQTDDVSAAREAFRKLGYQVHNLRIVSQEEATRIAQLI